MGRDLSPAVVDYSRQHQRRSNQQETLTRCQVQAQRAQPPKSPSDNCQSATGATTFPQHYGQKFAGQGEKKSQQRLKMLKIWKKPHQPPD